ncbi:hypothetical protein CAUPRSCDRAFT_12948 [Caulochytrium protostelioides]|uniref:Uncharacterized protein n=1 Tax=Caulochytrium protostelioides TaxID=1555241 RepID=A0A4P9WTP1_9FUNG|nr:hypothetical protein CAUPRSCDRAFT_12948 [Caulochytrium protostelioides]
MASSPSLVGHGDLVSPRPGTTALYATPHLETVQPATGSTPSPSAFPDEAARRDHAAGGTGTVAGAGGSRPASPAPPHQLSQSDGASVPPGPAASASASGGIVAMGTIPADGRFNPPNQVVQSMVVPPLAPIQAKLTLDMAVRDSPQFRAHIARFQDDMDVIARWLEGLTKALRDPHDDRAEADLAPAGRAANDGRRPDAAALGLHADDLLAQREAGR